jgi:transcriptional regulator with XRE-family HTH domain
LLYNNIVINNYACVGNALTLRPVVAILELSIMYFDGLLCIMDESAKAKVVELVKGLRLKAGKDAGMDGPMPLRPFALLLGVNYAALNSWETGVSSPEPQNLEKIAIYMGLTFTELWKQLTGEEIEDISVDKVYAASKQLTDRDRLELIKRLSDDLRNHLTSAS